MFAFKKVFFPVLEIVPDVDKTGVFKKCFGYGLAIGFP